MRLFIVEDEVLLGLDLRHMLSHLGHQVVASVTRLDEAVRRIEDAAFDVAIVDLNLGGESLCRLLCDKWPALHRRNRLGDQKHRRRSYRLLTSQQSVRSRSRTQAGGRRESGFRSGIHQ